jgi:Bacterial transcriptional activator domain
MILTAFAGACAGLGVIVVIIALRPAPPRLDAIFARLDGTEPVPAGRDPGLAGWLAERLVRPPGCLTVPRAGPGNRRLYPQIFRDRQHLPQPGGCRLTDPNPIYASPAAHAGVTSKPAAGDAATHPDLQPPAPVPAPRPSGAGIRGSAQAARACSQRAAHHAGHPGVPVTAVAGYGAMMASVTPNTLTFTGGVRQHKRRSGRRISIPAAMSEAEQGIRGAAGPGSVQLLDQALRSLAAWVTAENFALPAVTGALVTASGVELLPASPAGPVPPFGASWQLDTSSAAALPGPEAAREVPAPYPALVTLGDDANGTHVLADLAEAGAVSLLGDLEHVREILCALALEMAASPWADCIVINCAGFGAELPRLAGTGRLQYAASADEILTRLRAHAHEASAVLAGSGADPVRAARSRQVPGDVGMPEILLSATPLTGEQLAVIAELVSAGPDRVNLAAVVAAAGGDPVLPGPWQLDATPGRTVRLPVLDREITLQRVTAAQYRQLAADLGTAGDDRGVPVQDDSGTGSQDEVSDAGGETTGRSDTGEERAGPQGNTVTSPAAADPRAPRILVLGAPVVAGRDVAGIESGKRNLLPELAAYLRLNPGRTAEEVSRAMGGPRGPWAAATRASNMSRLRAWLGRDPAGRNYVPALGEGRLYTLLSSVRCDWDDFRQLARRGLAVLPADAGVADLQAALDLVRGQPFAGAGPHSYIWAEFAKQEMISAIVDVAHALAERLTEAGDPAGARTAVARGLEVEPGSELLFRDLFRAEHRAGNAAGIEEAAERLMVTLGELDLDMEHKTADLLSELRGHRRVATSSAARAGS